MTLGPLVRELESKLKQNSSAGIISTIIDDISMASNFENVIEALKHVKNGKRSGYKINFDKTQYIMCKVTNREELLRKLHIAKKTSSKYVEQRKRKYNIKTS